MNAHEEVKASDPGNANDDGAAPPTVKGTTKYTDHQPCSRNSNGIESAIWLGSQLIR